MSGIIGNRVNLLLIGWANDLERSLWPAPCGFRASLRGRTWAKP